mgnify:CR=1 FL=1
MATLKSIKNSYNQDGVDTNTENISVLSFKVATENSLSKFNLVDGFSDDYNDATGVDASGSTNAVRESGNYYNGSADGAVTELTSASANYTVPAGWTEMFGGTRFRVVLGRDTWLDIQIRVIRPCYFVKGDYKRVYRKLQLQVKTAMARTARGQ